MSDLTLSQFVEMVPALRDEVREALQAKDLVVIEDTLLKWVGPIGVRAWEAWLQEWVDRVDGGEPAQCPVCKAKLGKQHR
jgi:hypothetical protein